jgi:D-alanyl-D-alanine carboxypeptidase
MQHVKSLLAPVAALALLVAACGGSDDSGGATTEADSAPASAPATTGGASPTGEASTGTMSPDDVASVDDAAQSFLGQAGANGVTAFYVAISDPDKGDFVQAYGDASIDGPAATVDDNFRIGSVTKAFTATVVLQLIEEGELAVDDTVADVLPDLAVDYPDLAPITVEQLLSMTSGVEDYLNVPDSVAAEIVADPTRVWGAGELIGAGVSAGVAAPGTPGYSTTNFIVLQLMAEMVTDSTLQDLIAERITNPLGVEHLFLPPNDDTTLPDPVTHGYVAGGCVEELAKDGATIEDGTDVTDWNASYGQGGGGMTSNISDLHAWAATTSGNDLLDADTVTRRLTFGPVDGIEYGLGLMRIGTWVGHEGEAIGWETLAMHDPDSGVTMAVAANGCGGLIGPFADFFDALYPDGAMYEALVEGSESSANTAASTTPGAAASTTTTNETPEVPASEASGTATFLSGDISIEGDVVECVLAEPEVSFTAVGENAEFEVFSVGGGDVDVVASGTVEFEGRGKATINGGAVKITGAGSEADAGTKTQDFTIDAQIGAC